MPRVCKINPYHRKYESGEPRFERDGHSPKYNMLIDAVEDLAIECLGQESFVEMLKIYHQKKPKQIAKKSGISQIRNNVAEAPMTKSGFNEKSSLATSK
jgi:hypothetical protein